MRTFPNITADSGIVWEFTTLRTTQPQAGGVVSEILERVGNDGILIRQAGRRPRIFQIDALRDFELYEHAFDGVTRLQRELQGQIARIEITRDEVWPRVYLLAVDPQIHQRMIHSSGSITWDRRGRQPQALLSVTMAAVALETP
jgi:hypothetical protein